MWFRQSLVVVSCLSREVGSELFRMRYKSHALIWLVWLV